MVKKQTENKGRERGGICNKGPLSESNWGCCRGNVACSVTMWLPGRSILPIIVPVLAPYSCDIATVKSDTKTRSNKPAV